MEEGRIKQMKKIYDKNVYFKIEGVYKDFVDTSIWKHICLKSDNEVLDETNYVTYSTFTEQFLFFTILDKLTKKYHLLWSYYWEDNKDYSSLGFCLTEDSKKRIDINYSKKLDNIKIKFYNYNGKEIKAILRYIKKKNKIINKTETVK